MANEEPKTWSDFSVNLYDKLTGRNAEITYEFDDFDLYVPTSTGPAAKTEHAHWKMNGTLRIRTKENAKQ